MDTQSNLNFNNVFDSLRKNLLDMGLRNNLLNFREVARTIHIVDEDIVELFEILVLNKNKMEFLPTNLENSSDNEMSNIWEMPIDLENIPEKYRDLYLQTNLTESNLQKKLFSLFQYNNSSIQEYGYNTLFIALGYLEWKEVESAEKFLKAPLILVPVTLTRKSIDAPFMIRWNGDDISFNLSLKHKLLDQDLDLPIPDKIDSKEDLYDYLNHVKKSVSRMKDWNVTGDIYLSPFSFKKFVMYNDLSLKNWSTNLLDGEIGRLFGLKEVDTFDAFDINSIDTLIQPKDSYNVMDADSSQIAVIEDVKRGHSLVVEGPPGTGKSQTIVNLIAELLANKKSVLFVSEKMAALDVVKNRMDTVGLGSYCLKLHGNTIRNKEFLEDLQSSLIQDKVLVNDYEDYDNLVDVKNYLNNYMNIIQSNYGNTNLSIYDLIGIHEYRYQKLEVLGQKIYKFNMPSLVDFTTQDSGELLNNIDKISELYKLVSPIKENPWRYTSVEYISPDDVDNIQNKSRELDKRVNILVDTIHTFSEITNMKEIIAIQDISKYIQCGYVVISNVNYEEDKKLLQQLLLAIENYRKHFSFTVEEYTFDIEDLRNQFIKLEKQQSESIISSRILIQKNIPELLDNFKKSKENIDLSEIHLALYDSNLLEKVNKFKAGKDSFTKFLNKGYKSARNELKGYYNHDVDDDTMANDFSLLLSWNDQVIRIRNSILPYTSFNNLSDEEIIYELEKLQLNDELISKINIEVASVFDKEKFSSFNEIKHHLDLLYNRDSLLKFINQHENIAKIYFRSWNGIDTNLETLRLELTNIENFFKTQKEENIEIKQINDSVLINELKEKLQTIEQVYSDILDDYGYLNKLLHFKGKLNQEMLMSIKLSDFNNQIHTISENISSLNNWNQFNKFCDEYNNVFTKDFIELIRKDEIKQEAIVLLFEYNIANNILKEVFKQNNTLKDFNSVIYEKNIERFKKLEQETIKLNKYRVREILDKNKPDITQSIMPTSQLGILEHEINKKKNFKSIRQLLIECHDVISQIKPCFLMSPLSIAQYLDTKTYESYFDYVIFDEASQVRVEDAIGALLRGKHYVIIGDTKQLPPTSFFDVETSYETDNKIQVEDVESILHFSKTVLPYRMLKCHYRSRHESLIAVSNMEFYNNELYVYPSPVIESDKLGLKFNYNPDSIYDRGKSRQNKIEARQVVDYALKHYTKYGDTKSLGVGTFSVAQRQAILEELEHRLKENSQLEKYFYNDKEDTFFVKNIENIQGDERDVILISIGYGYDINHNLSMNFGPLNNEGGERRLNVLTTRAKEKCVIFSNFKSADMRITPKTPVGIKVLKTYLFYAEKGEFPSNYQTEADFDSDFEKSVYDFLVNEGYQVAKQVGCAGYRIDLAIIDKNDSDEYILAIECDGAAYHSSTSARDRDRLRQNILEGLGWTFHRIWSTDWYHNRENAKQTLLKKVEEAVKYKENKERVDEFEKIENHNSKKSTTINTVKIPTEYTNKISDESKINYTKVDNNDIKLDNKYEYYKNTIKCNDFYNINDNDILQVIEDIVKIESPICKDEIYNRLKNTYQIKATQKFKKRVDKLLNEIILLTNQEIYCKNNFYFNVNIPVKVRKRDKANIEYISDEEIIEAIKQCLILNDSLIIDDLTKQVSLLFGFKILSSKTGDKIYEVINYLRFSDIINVTDEKQIILNKK